MCTTRADLNVKATEALDSLETLIKEQQIAVFCGGRSRPSLRSIDQNLKIAFGKKDVAFGALEEHKREHGCRQRMCHLINHCCGSRVCDKALIEFRMLNKEDEMIIYVRDNGAGFDMDHAGNLFGAFQRLRSDSEFQGSGMGLATVQCVVRGHSGRVWAEARVNSGAAFSFTLGAAS